MVYVDFKKAIIVAGGQSSRMKMNIQKGCLNIGGRPNVEWHALKLKEAGVRDIYVRVEHNSYDLVRVLGDGSRFRKNGEQFRIHYAYDEGVDIASGVYNIVFGKFKKDFEGGGKFLVTASDVGDPTFNWSDYIRQYLAVPENIRRRTLGAVAFVARPIEDVVKKFPTAAMNDSDIITKTFDKPPSNLEEGKLIKTQVRNRHVDEFEKMTGLPGLPLPTFFYILSKEALRGMSEMASELRRSEKDMDFYRHIFKLLPNKLLALFLKEDIINRKLIRSYYDLNWPEMFYRANYQFIKTAYNVLAADHQLLDELNSFVGFDVNFWRTPEGKIPNIRDSVFHKNSTIEENTIIEKSVIGSGSFIRKAIVRRSIILPNTYINYEVNPANPEIIIEDSIVGGAGEIFVDMRHNQDKPVIVNKKIVVPDERGSLTYHELDIGGEDRDICEEAFKK